MSNVFFNEADRRVRALWRLLLIGGIFLGLSGIFSVIVGLIMVRLAIAGGINPTDAATLTDYIAISPWTLFLGSAAELAAIIICFIIASKWPDRRLWRDFGFSLNKTWWFDFGFGLLLGAVLMGLIFAVELAAGWVKITGILLTPASGQSIWAGLLMYFGTFICVAFAEEMLMRGYILRNLAEGLRGKLLNPRAALLAAYFISSVVFSLAHLGNPNSSLASTLSLIAAGLFLGSGYIWTGSLAIPIGLHLTWNFFQGNIMDFPVSGLGSLPSVFSIQQQGPEPVTGGAFGPEAGLIGVAAMILGALLIAFWVRRTRGSVKVEERLAVWGVLIRA